MFGPADAHAVAHALKRVVRRYPVVGFLAAIALLIVLGAANYDNARRQAEAAEWVTHTYQVTEVLQEVTDGMGQAESAVRGYAINHDQRFLQAFAPAVAMAEEGLAEAQALTADNPAQHAAVIEVRPKLARRFELLRQLVTDADTGGAVSVPEEALRLGSEIRATIQGAHDYEHALLAERRARADGETDRTVWTTALGVLTSLFLLGGVFAALTREIRERGKVERSLRSKHALIESLMKSSGDALYVKDLEGRYLLINDAGAEINGRTVAEMLGKTDFELLPADAAVRARDVDLAIMRSGTSGTSEMVIELGGTKRVFESTKGPWRDPEQGVLGVVGITRDVTERRSTDEARHLESSVLLQMGELLQSCRGADEAYRVVELYAAQLFRAESGVLWLFHSSRNALEARARWGDVHLEDPRLHFMPDDCWAIRRGRSHVTEAGGASMGCRHVAVELTGSMLCQPLVAQGELLGVLQIAAPRELSEETQRRVAVVGDQISLALANLQLRETLRNQSIRDPLTGLYNRRYAEETLRREIDRSLRSSAPLAVLALDVDHFKRFNDSFGHEAGDLVLRELGAVLLRGTRPIDVASRMGGEELLVLLPGVDQTGAVAKAERLRKAINALDLRHHGKALGSITASIGVGVLGRHAQDGEVLLRVADEALYRAKREGRDRVVVAPDLIAPRASLSPPPRGSSPPVARRSIVPVALTHVR